VGLRLVDMVSHSMQAGGELYSCIVLSSFGRGTAVLQIYRILRSAQGCAHVSNQVRHLVTCLVGDTWCNEQLSDTIMQRIGDLMLDFMILTKLNFAHVHH
jgi:hypothetical protein